MSEQASEQSTLIAPLVTDIETVAHYAVTQLPLIGIGIICFVIMFMLAKPISRLAIKPLGLLSKSELVRVVGQRVVSFIVILLGAYIFMRLAGLTQFAIALVSGTGIAGLVIGFAFKDIAENFISSLLLSVQKPFKIGDVIEVNGHLGVINSVTARSTTLVDFDGNHIQIPNAIIYKNTIKNFSANPKMRSHFIVGIGYDSSIVQAQDIGMDILKSHDAVLAEPAPQVLVDTLGSSTINLKVYFWVNSDEHSVLKVSSMLQRLIMRALENANISMPDDARERIISFDASVNSLPSLQENLNNERSSAGPAIPTGTITNKQSQRTNQTEQAAKHLSADSDINAEHNEISSDVAAIKKQAQQSRSPEQGDNIL
ncbi:mechanosensitive ion channel family protein [Glaciecola siphonariae]|uniref:Small-conductance mechanosensitive channel n=1 Tax=Glaciecola siphonariae TaxID=521012 RepID=A0ABV9LR22_9ALTE